MLSQEANLLSFDLQLNVLLFHEPRKDIGTIPDVLEEDRNICIIKSNLKLKSRPTYPILIQKSENEWNYLF